MRFGKIASCVFFVLFASSQGYAADTQTQKTMKDFETRMVKPCEGKKSGDQVQVVSPRGATLMATCKLTAEINIK